ncbi:sugar phosphate nucleotidyltransferase [Calditrichota bacterium]
MAKKSKKIEVQGTEITLFYQAKDAYISLTDIARYKDPNRTDYIIQNWLRNKNSIEFLGIWERLNNPDFKPIEFDGFRNQAGLNSFEIKGSYWKRMGIEEKENLFLGSMGIYLFKRDVLEKILKDGDETDFGREVFPRSVKEGMKVYAYPFQGYWEDIGTIRSFYDANLNLVDPVPRFNFYNEKHPVYTHARFLPPSKISDASTEHAILSEGCIVGKATLKRSIVGVRSRVGDSSEIIDSIIMGSEYYEDSKIREENKRTGRPNLGIGHNCIIKNAIIDKDARIGDNVRIIGKEAGEQKGDGWMLRDGIIVIEKNAVIPEGTILEF